MFCCHKRNPDLKLGNLTVCEVMNELISKPKVPVHCWAYFYFILNFFIHFCLSYHVIFVSFVVYGNANNEI